ncbi:hypothetical protein R75465_08497 [Paraburkholderia aspalathi]|uniref:DUF3658 domain-containing protein n=1 Tax=Paraburkholderia aspalathi TaxID=1324617 RepID=UPI001B2B2299|nr:DUF3658 domain-containing protein [Paraburkholderia aspalathi]CAE6874237.1 hypothetical protein R75465_08497 [Paraburkholderia aspalathi]
MKTDAEITDGRNPRGAKCLNVVFSDDSYHMVQKFLKIGRGHEEIAVVTGGYHLGHINNDNYAKRRAWVKVNLGIDLDDMTMDVDQSDILFEMATGGNHDIFAWVDFSCPAEYANFLHWSSRKKPVGVFVVKPIPLSMSQDPRGGEDRDISSLDYVRSSANAIQQEDVEKFESLWKILETENSAFRLFDGAGQLRSVKIDAFDDVLAGSVRFKWELMPTVVLRAMNECWSSGRCFPGDLFFYKRLAWLGENSNIEIKMDINDITRSELRIRAST